MNVLSIDPAVIESRRQIDRNRDTAITRDLHIDVIPFLESQGAHNKGECEDMDVNDWKLSHCLV